MLSLLTKKRHTMSQSTESRNELSAANSSFVQSLDQTTKEVLRFGGSALALPFEMARQYYANAIQAGLAPRSMLASRNFALALDACEKSTLGPWARRV